MPLPIELFMDTSFLRGYSPRKITARILVELVDSGDLRIHVPWVVEREFGTQCAGMIEKLKRDYYHATNWAPDDVRAGLFEKLGGLDNYAKGAADIMARGVGEWLTRLDAVRAMPSEVADDAFSAYFKGDRPFRSVKSREDIPDGFIVAAIRKFAAGATDPVHVLVKDKRVAEACASLGAVVHSDVVTVFRLPELAPTVSTVEMMGFLRTHRDELRRLLQWKLSESVLGLEVESPEFPSDSNDATVSGFGEAENLQFDLDRADVIAAEAINLQVSCDVMDNLVDLFIFKAEYLTIGDEDTRFSLADVDWNEHYVHAEAHVDLALTASVTVEVKKEGTGARSFGDVEVSVLEVEVTEVHERVPS